MFAPSKWSFQVHQDFRSIAGSLLCTHAVYEYGNQASAEMLNGRWFAGRMVLVEYLAPKVSIVGVWLCCRILSGKDSVVVLLNLI